VDEQRRPLHHRVLHGIVSLPDHKLLDRVVRGRAWIPVLGVLLATIVGMRVEVLKMGASVGRAVTQASTLQSENELLRQSVSTLSSSQRIEGLAAHYGMVMPSASDVHFIHAGSGSVKTEIAARDPATFRESVAEEEAANPYTVIPASTFSAVDDTTADSSTSSTVGDTTGVTDATGVTDPSAIAAADTSAATGTTDTGGAGL
jgi:cell division protein FtsL